MDWKLILPAITAILIGGLGWYVVHYLNLRREITAEKRKLRVTYLLEVYRKLEGVSNRGNPMERQHAHDMESALADIQLLGTPKQVEFAANCTTTFARDGTVSLDDILADLRQSLRDELELEPINIPLRFLRINTPREKQ